MGREETGRTITHTFASAATDNVTMSISQGSGCQSLTTSQQVTIGRSTDWIALSGTLPPKFEMVSSVAGYILYGTVYVAAGHTLTVDPGANVRFASANGESGQLIVNGTLQANGLSGAPATFTSQNDTSSPSWAGITTTNGGTLNLNYADVRNAQAAVWLQGSGATVNVKNSTLELSGDGLWSEFANAVTVTGTTFSNDGTGAEIDCSGCSYQPALTSDTFSSDSTGADVTGVAAPNLVDTTFTNTAQPVVLAATATRTTIQQTTVTPGRGYVEILGGSFPNGSVNLRSDLPYVISGAATIPTSGEVTVGPGVIVKFASGGGSVGQLTVSGELIASGTPGAEPIFTSAYDDSAGGHCGCVGTGRSPAPGDWYGLTTTGTGGTIELDYADVRYAADGLWLQGSGATVNVSQSTVEDAGTGLWSENSNAVTVALSSLANDSTGMEFDCFGCTYSPSVTSTTFSSDPTGVYVTGEAAPEIHGSSFQPGTIGVLNGGNATVDASANWWGDPSGPAPGGTGATVSGNVKLNPFCVNSSCIVPPNALLRGSSGDGEGRNRIHGGLLFATGTPTPTLTVSGMLPPGLSAVLSDGTLSGTPTASGTFIFSIVATNSAGSATAGPYLVVVGAPVLESIEVTPASASVADGQTLQLDATGYFSDGSTQDLTSTVTWSFSDPTLASISSSAGTSGLLTAGGVGTGTATAIDGFVAGTTDVTISPASQAIAFPATPVTYGQTDFSPAEASSGLPVGYSDPVGACQVDAQELVQITGAGSCTVTASQPGNAAYEAAACWFTPDVIVAPAALFVDANDVSVAFGQTPTLGYSLSGFVNGENPTNAGVTGQASCTSTRPGRIRAATRGDHLHAGEPCRQQLHVPDRRERNVDDH